MNNNIPETINGKVFYIQNIFNTNFMASNLFSEFTQLFNKNINSRLKGIYNSSCIQRTLHNITLIPVFCSYQNINIKKYIKIGKGGYGNVFSINDKYILKKIIFKDDESYNDELKALVFHYLLTLSLKNNNNSLRYICKLYEFGLIGNKESKNIYCIQDNGGEELYKYLVKKYKSIFYSLFIGVRDKLIYFLKILLECSRALKIIHDLDYVHMDIKSENFLIVENRDGSFQIKIIDFGYVSKIGSKIKDIRGTSQYINLIYIKKIYSKKEVFTLVKYDIFGLGCMFIEFIMNYILRKKVVSVLPFKYKINFSFHNNIMKKRYNYKKETIIRDLDIYLFNDLSEHLSNIHIIKEFIYNMVLPYEDRFENIDIVIKNILELLETI